MKEKNQLNAEGKRIGFWEFYHEGTLDITSNFKNGVLEGESKSYLKDGSIYAEGMYRNGEMEGEWKYYPKNKSHYSLHFRSGREVVAPEDREYYVKVRDLKEIPYDDDKKARDFCKKRGWKYYGIHTKNYAWSDEMQVYIRGAKYYCYINDTPFLLWEDDELITTDDIR